MTIPTLTPAQIFSNQVNKVIIYVAAALTGNINIQPPEGGRAPQVNFNSVYSTCYNTLFDNTNGTPAQAVALLSTQAASVFAFLAALYSLLSGAGVTGISALPAYTPNADGTVVLGA